MDWQAALRARLAGDEEVAGLAGERVHWIERPQAGALPAITLQTISEERAQHYKGFHGLQAARVQIDVWGARYAETRALAEAAIAALVPAHSGNGVRFSRGMVDRMSDGSERQGESNVFRVRIDLLIHHQRV